MVDIAIIIVNYRMADYVRSCLHSLAVEFGASSCTIHIVVVDNASHDDVQSVIHTSGCGAHTTLVELPKNRGYAAGVNAGMRAMRARYYFIINPDITFFEDATLLRLFRFMEENVRVGIVGPKLLYPDGSLQYSCWRLPTLFTPLYRRTQLGATTGGKKKLRHFLMQDFDHKKTIPVDCIMGSAMFVRAAAVAEVGDMSEEYFMYFEDIDWCRRFWAHHISVYYLHDVRLRHELKRDSAKVEGLKALFLNRMARVHVRSWLRYMWKWRERGTYV